MQQNYASVSTRIRAVIIDGIALMIVIYSATQLFEAIGQVHDVVRIATFILLFLLYEPILVSFFGATIGHFLMISWLSVSLMKLKISI
ncbi:MAG: RDD family protein [Bacteroidota bacterium]